jgi:hypothetical protein
MKYSIFNFFAGKLFVFNRRRDAFVGARVKSIHVKSKEATVEGLI